MIRDQYISVVYYRSGYSPNDYPTEHEWSARLLIEKSYAIKCPPISYHLAGCKKVQQALANVGVLEMFITNPSHRDSLRSVFAGLYSLNASNDIEKDELEKVKQHVIDSNGLNYVMKPQREGGGNNIYGVDVVKALESMTDDEQAAYILMERILPPSNVSQLVRNGEINEVSELCDLLVVLLYCLFLSEVFYQFDNVVNTLTN